MIDEEFPSWRPFGSELEVLLLPFLAPRAPLILARCPASRRARGTSVSQLLGEQHNRGTMPRFCDLEKRFSSHYLTLGTFLRRQGWPQLVLTQEAVCGPAPAVSGRGRWPARRDPLGRGLDLFPEHIDPFVKKDALCTAVGSPFLY